MNSVEREALKVGDSVGICGRWDVAIRTVTKRTRTQLVLSDDSRWSIGSGRRFGDETWSRAFLTTEADARERIAELRAKKARNEKIAKLRDAGWSNMTDEQLDRFIALLP